VHGLFFIKIPEEFQMNTDPEALDAVKEVKMSDEALEFLDEISQLATEEKGKRNQWEQRVDNWTRKRYGLRSKKTSPWQGCANFMLPQMDTDINRLKPAYINMAFGVSPICTFEPFGPNDIQPAKMRESLFDWRMRTQVDFFKPYCLAVDRMEHIGFTVFKTGWKFETSSYSKKLNLADLDQKVLEALYMPEVDDATLFHIIAEDMKPDLTLEENVKEIQRVVGEFRAGKTKFEFTFTEKTKNCAVVQALDPREEVIFPVDCCDIQEAEFIEHRFSVTKNQLKKAMKDGRYKTYDDYEIEKWEGKVSPSNSTADYLKNIRDGVSNNSGSTEKITLCEICSWFDVDGDGIEERVIVTYPLNNPRSVLRFIENPFDHGLFPYVVVRRELNDAEILSSRGIPALDDDFQTGISTLFNQDIDAGTIATTPTVVARKNSVKNLRNLRYVPGQVVETENGVQDYSVVQNPNIGQSQRFANMQYLKSWANDRVGNMQAAISSTNNMPGASQIGTKTAKEVGAIASMASQNTAMDLLVFQYQMKDLYFQIDALYEQFGDETETMLMIGQVPITYSRQDIQGKFNIVPNGKVNDADPTMRMQRNQMMMQMFANDPYVRQDQLRKSLMDSVDMRLSQVLLKTPQEMQADQVAQVKAENDKLGVALNMQKAKNMMEVQKAAMLTPIEGRKYAAN
jgi:hypothetical protein